MTPHQEALWASVEHWLQNWEDPDTAHPMGDDCPCCQEYHDEAYEGDHGCEECPISQYTGKGDCDGTPWNEARNTWRKYLDRIASDPKNIPTKEEVQVAFEAEYRFLVELALGELK